MGHPNNDIETLLRSHYLEKPWNKDVLGELPLSFTIIYSDVTMWGCYDSARLWESYI